MQDDHETAADLLDLRRLRDATDSYLIELGRARPAAERLRRRGDDRAGYLLDGIAASIDAGAISTGTVAQLRQALAELLTGDERGSDDD